MIVHDRTRLTAYSYFCDQPQRGSNMENKMGVMPIGRLLANMSAPPMVSMLAVALYNIVDSIFVARVSENALTAVTLVFPIQMFVMSINVGIGVGLTSLISRRLGEKRQGDAESAAVHGFFFAFVTWILYVLFAIFAAGPFIQLFTGTQGQGEIYEMALIYCRIVMIGSLFLNVSITIKRILQATGNTFHPMLFNIIGVGVNTILAPILIIGYFGAPSLGVAGAGYAAVIGQGTGLAVALCILFSRKHAVRVSFKGFKPRLEITRDILVVGVPTIVMNAAMPILISLLNKLLFSYGSAVFILGVYFRISTFVILPVIGLNNGALPIMGYNFGAKNRLRLVATYKTAIAVALIIMIAGTAIFWVFPDRIMTIYSATGDTFDMGVHALRVISLCWIPGAFTIISIGMMQALAHGGFALIITLVRQLGFVLPLAYFLLTRFGVYGYWYAFSVAEVFALVITALFVRYIFKKEINKLPEGVK